jgi:hypothetical protein
LGCAYLAQRIGYFAFRERRACAKADNALGGDWSSLKTKPTTAGANKGSGRYAALE